MVRVATRRASEAVVEFYCVDVQSKIDVCVYSFNVNHIHVPLLTVAKDGGLSQATCLAVLPDRPNHCLVGCKMVGIVSVSFYNTQGAIVRKVRFGETVSPRAYERDAGVSEV